jgi:hypothetical protein
MCGNASRMDAYGYLTPDPTYWPLELEHVSAMTRMVHSERCADSYKLSTLAIVLAFNI